MKFLPACLVLAELLLGASLSAAVIPDRPNVVIILADDMGWVDLGCYGADLHETPYLDALAREGVRFTDAYAMSVCSPTRATLLTGRHAARLHITNFAEGAVTWPKQTKLKPLPTGASLNYLPHEETTIAAELHGVGYLTTLVGKWHLGDTKYYPETHGFDVNIGGTHWGSPNTYFWPYNGSSRFREFRFVPHLEFGHPGEYLTDRLTDEALRVIDHADGKPFFIYLAHYSPHIPLEAKPDDVAYFEGKIRPGMQHQNAAYAAMVRNLDENVGRVLLHLRARGLEKSTIVIFASDNGGVTDPDRGSTIAVTDNTPLRSGKGGLYEGGIRVPLIIRWPGVAVPGAECHEPVFLADLFPTLRTAGVQGVSPMKVELDGLDLSPLLKDPTTRLARDDLFFHYPHYYKAITTPVGAVRARDWKLLEYFEDGQVKLYNLRNDLSEVHDLAAQMPAKAEELRQRLHAWRARVGAALPQNTAQAAR